MTERLLHYLWQFGYYSHAGLCTQGGEPVQVLERGQYNTNAGPDFLDARIRIGPAVLAGSVELHLRTSDWQRHRHDGDPNFRNVILHVVFEHDRPPEDPTIPVLELQPHVSTLLLERYDELLQQGSFIPCEHRALSVPDLVWTSWKDRLLVERLLQKTGKIFALLEAAQGDWEEVFWCLLARNFGTPVNADAFEELARSIPLKLLLRCRGSIHKLEALLLGQANLLHARFEEKYPLMLKREYRYLQKLHPLPQVHRAVQFMRMRPPAFPTVRLAQLAALLQQEGPLLARVLEADGPEELRHWLGVTANDYWNTHYRFDEESALAPKHLGTTMIENIFINTLVPLLFAWGHHHGQELLKERALQWLRALPPESNSVLKRFQKIGISADGAGDAQALLYLYKEYCAGRRCLDCAIGNALLKRDTINKAEGAS